MIKRPQVSQGFQKGFVKAAGRRRLYGLSSAHAQSSDCVVSECQRSTFQFQLIQFAYWMHTGCSQLLLLWDNALEWRDPLER